VPAPPLQDLHSACSRDPRIIELMYRKSPPRLELSRTEDDHPRRRRLITGLLRLAQCRSCQYSYGHSAPHSPRFGTSTDCRIYTAVSSDLPHRRRRLTSQIALRVRQARWHGLAALRPCLPSRCPGRTLNEDQQCRSVARFCAADVDEPGGSALSPLSGAVRAGVTPVLVFAEPLRPHIHARLQAGGAVIRVITTDGGSSTTIGAPEAREGVLHYGGPHRLFDYFSALPWIASYADPRSHLRDAEQRGAPCPIVEEGAAATAHVRDDVPDARVIAISEFVKKQLVTAGVPKTDRREIPGVNTERFRPDPQARRQWADRFSVRR